MVGYVVLELVADLVHLRAQLPDHLVSGKYLDPRGPFNREGETIGALHPATARLLGDRRRLHPPHGQHGDMAGDPLTVRAIPRDLEGSTSRQCGPVGAFTQLGQVLVVVVADDGVLHRGHRHPKTYRTT